jgi:hypothetical protein
VLSPSERLDRWAELLERNPNWRLATLHQTEYQSRDIRDAMRADNSPLSVAFDDPIFRAEGLMGDSYGEAMSFFGLEDAQLHEIICYCHFGMHVPAASAAREIRKILTPPSQGFFSGLMRLVFR